MGKIEKPLPVKLLFSMFGNTEEIFQIAEKIIIETFGKEEIISEKFIFNHTTYYEKEFGQNLYRKFLVIKTLYERDSIAKVKLITNKIEDELGDIGKRKINIDPGYISLENFILFTTKNYTHRIYLEKGIFADLTLIFQNKKFNSLPWTYPDYSSKEIKDFLKRIRDIYSAQIKESKEIIHAKTVQ